MQTLEPTVHKMKEPLLFGIHRVRPLKQPDSSVYFSIFPICHFFYPFNGIGQDTRMPDKSIQLTLAPLGG